MWQILIMHDCATSSAKLKHCAIFKPINVFSPTYAKWPILLIYPVYQRANLM